MNSCNSLIISIWINSILGLCSNKIIINSSDYLQYDLKFKRILDNWSRDEKKPTNFHWFSNNLRLNMSTPFNAIRYYRWWVFFIFISFLHLKGKMLGSISCTVFSFLLVFLPRFYLFNCEKFLNPNKTPESEYHIESEDGV